MPKTLLACSGGGHLKQLDALVERIGIPRDDQFWVTFDNGLSRSLLADREVMYAPFAAPRDAIGILRNRLMAKGLLRSRSFDLALSTGSSPGVAYLLPAVRAGIEAHYIESAARADGPSMSGRIVARNEKIPVYTQYPVWANARWQYRGSIFDSYRPGPESLTVVPIRKAVVSVGTQDGYRFDRLYDALAPLLAECQEVLWQTGPQDVSRWGIQGRATVPHHELQQAVSEADVVVAHSGTGAALTAMDEGKVPVLVPRLAKYKEHVDDHQIQIGAELERRGLAVLRHADELTADDLMTASRRSVVKVEAPKFELTRSELAA